MEYIEDNVFNSCYALSSIDIPATVKSVGAYCFSHCTSLKTLWVNNNNPYKILSVNPLVFSGLDLSQITLYVNYVNIDKYKSADVWKDFNPIYPVPYGYCGENIKWKFDDDTKTLTLTGDGEMYDYSAVTKYGEQIDGVISYPRRGINDSVSNLVIDEGITCIGKLAFSYFKNLKNIKIFRAC